MFVRKGIERGEMGKKHHHERRGSSSDSDDESTRRKKRKSNFSSIEQVKKGGDDGGTATAPATAAAAAAPQVELLGSSTSSNYTSTAGHSHHHHHGSTPGDSGATPAVASTAAGLPHHQHQNLNFRGGGMNRRSHHHHGYNQHHHHGYNQHHHHGYHQHHHHHHHPARGGGAPPVAWEAPRTRKVCIANVPPTASEMDVRRHFSAALGCATTRLTLAADTQQWFVEFDSEEAAERAAALPPNMLMISSSSSSSSSSPPALAPASVLRVAHFPGEQPQSTQRREPRQESNASSQSGGKSKDASLMELMAQRRGISFSTPQGVSNNPQASSPQSHAAPGSAAQQPHQQPAATTATLDSNVAFIDNMVATSGDIDDDLQEDVRSELQKLGKLLFFKFFAERDAQGNERVRLVVEYPTSEGARSCVLKMNGRMFDRRPLRCGLMNRAAFEALRRSTA